MSKALDELTVRLQRDFVLIPSRQTHGWTNADAIKGIQAVNARFDTPVPMKADQPTILAAMKKFQATGNIPTFRDLKYVCLGACMPIQGQGVVPIADPKLRAQLLDRVETVANERRLRICFLALLQSFWSFPASRFSSEPEFTAFRSLGEWLQRTRLEVEKAAKRKLWWMTPLADHSNLLGSNPCQKYATSLLSGDTSLLDEAHRLLAIPENSWVKQEALMAQIRAATRLKDSDFLNHLDALIHVVSGKTPMYISPELQKRCVALLVSRYVRGNNLNEHMTLRDAAVSVIGNPWLLRKEWDAYVVDEQGEPDHQAREMVNGWLKRRLITDFFDLLSADGIGDRRRLDYWIRFEPFISDMWFVLGSLAQKRRDREFMEFRQRASGRLLNLEGTTSDNNAFIMRIEDVLAVEFGADGNACYVYDQVSLLTLLSQALESHNKNKLIKISINSLKTTNRLEKLAHRDGHVSGSRWEERFDAIISDLTHCNPDQPVMHRDRSITSGFFCDKTSIQKFTMEELEKFSITNRCVIKDNRRYSGVLWVQPMGNHLFGDTTIATNLRNWGFQYKPGKGWWKE
ncbi:MAG: hypothetical protein HQL99_15670 [Magnetococcales bacterium]|nr:hypothetical protein [Magnetococcales bacterium]